MSGKTNKLVEALYRTLASQHENWSICPGDDLLSLTPLAAVGANWASEQTSRGDAAGPPSALASSRGATATPTRQRRRPPWAPD